MPLPASTTCLTKQYIGAVIVNEANAPLLRGSAGAQLDSGVRSGVSFLAGARRAPFAMKFEDRQQAGVRLAQALMGWRGRPDLIVLALPRGGVPVAAEVAKALSAPLDVLVVRKLGYPGQEEFAMGAIALRRCARDVRHRWCLAGFGPGGRSGRAARAGRAGAARTGLPRREAAAAHQDQVVILVDDGLATGATMRAAVQSVRAGQPAAHHGGGTGGFARGGGER